MKKRIVVIASNNQYKAAEFERNFQRYGIEVRQVQKTNDKKTIDDLLQEESETHRNIAVFVEQSKLISRVTGTESDLTCSLEPVDHISELTVYQRKEGNGDLQEQKYIHTIEGYLDLSLKSDGADVFGWDDIFVPRTIGTTYHQLKKQGSKISSRDWVIGEFLKDSIYYKKRINMAFEPLSQERTIDFNQHPADFIEGEELYHGPWIERYRISNLFTAVLNSGIFFRSAQNRREKNYWWPGLNAGIPWTPKKDKIHERTFTAHDLGHHLIPDLIFTGEDSPKNRKVYLASRMISEAVTLVLADMVYVDALEQQGIEYDFSGRKIHPLFEDSGIDLTDEKHLVENLETLLRANIQYCLRGDDSKFRKLLEKNRKGTENLELFKEKYMPFFVEDFRWTIRNYNAMTANADTFRKWWKTVGNLRDQLGVDIETIDEVREKISSSDKGVIDAVTDYILTQRVLPIFDQKKIDALSRPTQLERGFQRFIIGQMGIFAHYSGLPETERYQDRMVQYLLENKGNLNGNKIMALRGFYDQFVDILLEKSIISPDDSATFKEVYPLFEPSYAFYDEGKGFYEDLKSISKRVLGD